MRGVGLVRFTRVDHHFFAPTGRLGAPALLYIMAGKVHAPLGDSDEDSDERH